MSDFTLNDNANVTEITIGQEHTSLLVIDDFATNPDDLITYAGDGSLFEGSLQNFYPGKRLLTPQIYTEAICAKYLPLLKSTFGLDNELRAKPVMSALAISDMAPNQLKPMQMLPHFDTTLNNQMAIVHYLCGSEHGGTSFYRHRTSSFERITADRIMRYGAQLKKEAIKNQLHKNPCYINGSNTMFEQIYTVEAKMNRAVIYPSNLLHSGNINPRLGLSSDPKKGRLTIGSFILLSQ